MKYILSFITVLLLSSPIVSTAEVVIDNDRGELFVHNNPWQGDLFAGENAGFQVWIGRDLTATPAKGDTVAGTIYITNEMNRGNIWGIDVVTMQLKGEADGMARAAEFEVHRSIGKDASSNPYDGVNPRSNGVEVIAQTDNTDLLTSAIMTWAGEKTGAGWWQEGISLSRVKTTGIHFHNLNDNTPAFQNAAILDSGSGTTLKVEGVHENIIDVSNSDFYNFVKLSDINEQVLAFSGRQSWMFLLDSGKNKQTMFSFSSGGNPVYSWIKNAGDDFVLYHHPRNKTVMMFDHDGSNPVSLYINGELKRIEVGEPDSAGEGYRLLRVLN